MAWFKVDDNFYDHPKVDELSLEAVGLWTLCGTYCAKQLTDGRIPTRRVYKLGGSEDSIAELIDAGMWDEAEDGYQFRNWGEYQPTRDDVESAREAARERKRKQRRGKSGQFEPSESHSETPAEATPESHRDTLDGHTVTPSACHADVTPESRTESHRPDPSRPIPTNVSSNEETTSEVSDETPRPDVDQILDAIDEHCRERDFKAPSRTKANTAAARLLIDKDGYSVENVLWIIAWVARSEFWAGNIRSASKLREKFDTLKHQAMRDTATASRPSPAATRRDETVAMIQRLQAEEDAKRAAPPESQHAILGEIL